MTTDSCEGENEELDITVGHVKDDEYYITINTDLAEKTNSIRTKQKKSNSVGTKINTDSNELSLHKENLMEILKCSNATPIYHNNGSHFMCAFCDDKYADPSKLKAHTIDIHKNQFLPNFCHTKKYHQVTLHEYLVKLDISHLRCKLCDEEIQSLELLMAHLIEIHQRTLHTNIKSLIFPLKFEVKSFQCCICSDDKFPNFVSLVTHMHSHYAYYVCGECGAGFAIGGALTRHRKTHKKETSPRHCVKVFDDKAAKERVSQINEVTITPNDKSIKEDPESSFGSKMTKKKTPDFSELSKHRHNIHTVMQYSNATPIGAHYFGNGYACCFCKEFFIKTADLKTHTIQAHSSQEKNKFMQLTSLSRFMVKLDITALSCNICQMEIQTLDEVIDHLNKAHDKTIYTDIKNHMVCFKLDDEVLKCMFCGNKYNSFKGLLEHMNKHYRNYVCDVCDAGFVCYIMLFNHKQAHKVGQFKCDPCGKVFDTLRKRQSHEKIVHTTYFSKCFQCGEKFSSFKLKREHMTETHGTSYEVQCLACGKMCKDQQRLRVHKRRDHMMERSFKCDHCDKSFYTSTLLKLHLATHSDRREFQCDLCSKAFRTKKTLIQHMNTHKEFSAPRYKCKLCSRAFIYPSWLKCHKLDAHGITPTRV